MKNSADIFKLSAEELNCPHFLTSEELPSTVSLTEMPGFVGQQRALEAIRCGLRTPLNKHIFVAALPGFGKRRAVLNAIEDYIAASSLTPPDDIIIAGSPIPNIIRVANGTASVICSDFKVFLKKLAAAVSVPSEMQEAAEQFLKEPQPPELNTHIAKLVEELSLHLASHNHKTHGLSLMLGGSSRLDSTIVKFRLNPFVASKGIPVIYSDNLEYGHIFGTRSAIADDGFKKSCHMNFHAGLIHKSSGGWLILDAASLQDNKRTWSALKRAIAKQSVNLSDCLQDSELPPYDLEIPLKLKVILLGTPAQHQQLCDQDQDFRKLFPIKAEFEEDMPRTAQTEREFAGALAALSLRYGLPGFSYGAIEELLDYSSRLAEHKEKISLDFRSIFDMACEAGEIASARFKTSNISDCPKATNDVPEPALEQNNAVTADDVRQAQYCHIRRSSASEDKLRELTSERVIVIETDGARTGQVNGLTVIDTGDYSYGRPVRISARVSAGKDILDIERESETGGKIHSKGIFVMTGFINGRFASEYPLPAAISVCLEQNYDEIEGDSASCAETLAIMSALGGIALSQSIAVTGSIDQFGNMQAVGGLAEKIESFYKACHGDMLTGKQGAIIPQVNIKHLVLNEEVRQAVKDGHFTIWAVPHLDNALEILSGLPAGSRSSKGKWPAKSCNGIIAARLEEMSKNQEDSE
ncbi:MAG: AAA family ATPase [bacterium]|nr:AAA family ATPase [bacterium]